MEGSFENEEKGENCVNQDFLPFPQCFLFCEGNHFNLDRSNFFLTINFCAPGRKGFVCPSIRLSVSQNLYRVIKAFTTFPCFFFVHVQSHVIRKSC